MVGNRVKLLIHNMVSMLSETNFTCKNFILRQCQIWSQSFGWEKVKIIYFLEIVAALGLKVA